MYFSCWSNSSFSALLLLPVFLFFSFCWSKYPVFYLFAPIQLASSFCLLEQIFFFSTFPQNSTCLSLLPVGANILFSISLPQLCFILQFCHWSKHTSYPHFTPSLLASSFCPLEQTFYLSAFPQKKIIHPQSGFNPTANQSPAAFRSSAIRFDIRFIGI